MKFTFLNGSFKLNLLQKNSVFYYSLNMLSPQSKYVLRAIIYLQEIEDDQFVKISQIAKDTKLPEAYLSKLLKQLVEAGHNTVGAGADAGFQVYHVQLNQFFPEPAPPNLTLHRDILMGIRRYLNY